MNNRKLLRLSKRRMRKIEDADDNLRRYLFLANIIEHLKEDIRKTKRQRRKKPSTDVLNRKRSHKRKRETEEERPRKRRTVHNTNKEPSSEDDQLEGIFDDLPKDVGCVYHSIVNCIVCSSGRDGSLEGLDLPADAGCVYHNIVNCIVCSK